MSDQRVRSVLSQRLREGNVTNAVALAAAEELEDALTRLAEVEAEVQRRRRGEPK